MIKYLNNFDVLSVKENAVLAHGCNTFGAWGAGIAAQFRKKYPKAWGEYSSYCDKHFGDVPLGDCEVGYLDYGNNLFIANLFTQKTTGFTGVHASLEAIEESFTLLCIILHQSNLKLPVYMPKIGCGLGGLLWEDVEPVISKISEKHNVTVYVCTI